MITDIDILLLNQITRNEIFRSHDGLENYLGL